MTSFSERMGFVKPPEFMQLDGMTDKLSNLLCNFCFKILSNESHLGKIEDMLNDLLKRKKGSFRLAGGNLYSEFFDDSLFAESFSALDFHQKYSVMEFIIKITGRNSYGDSYVDELNQILKRENSGYRLTDDYLLVPIANQTELDEVSEAQHSNVGMVALHMNKAVACFADREKPDYDNSIKEAVSAMEALAQKITGKSGKSATLGKLIKDLDLHPCLIQAVDKLYGYTSDGGIRHAKKDDDPETDFDTAKFVIVTASALINFITAKCTHD